MAKNLLQSVQKLPIFTSSKTHTLLKLNAMYQKWFQILENWPLILTLFYALYLQLFCKGLAKIWMYVSYFEWRESQYTLESRISIPHTFIDSTISPQFIKFGLERLPFLFVTKGVRKILFYILREVKVSNHLYEATNLKKNSQK